jgi:hypothetical protein
MIVALTALMMHSRTEALGTANELSWRASPCSTCARQNTEAAICFLINADIVRQDGEQVELAFDEAQCPFRWREILEVAKSAYGFRINFDVYATGKWMLLTEVSHAYAAQVPKKACARHQSSNDEY